MSDRIYELIGRVLDGEATDAERTEVMSHLESHPEDRAWMEEAEKTGNLFRAQVRAEMEAVDLSGIWPGVQRGLNELEHDAAADPSAPAPPQRFRNWLETFLPFPAPALGWVAAAAAIAAVAIISPRLGQHGGGLAHGFVEVEQVDTPADTSVMIYDTPDDNVKFIWVFEGDEEPI